MRRRRVWLAVALVAGAIAYLTISGLSSATLYYLTVSEALDPDRQLGTGRIRVWGTIVRESVDWRPETIRLAFAITDGERQLPVVYQGPKPDLFDQPGVEAVVEGRLAEGTFVAERLLLKCPSKYEGVTGPG